MKKIPTKTLIFATKTEAAPFINGLNLQKTNIGPFTIYKNNSYFAVISGIGKIKSSLAVSLAVLEIKTDLIFNIGSCGALDNKFREGTVLNIDKIINHASGDTFHSPVIKGHKTAALLTVDKPVLSSENRKKLARYAPLADMEGAGFTEACNFYRLKGYIFKIISDTEKDLSQKNIIKKIRDSSNILYNYFQEKNILTENHFQIIK